MRLLNENLLVLIFLKVVSSQVNTDLKKLKSDFEMKGQIYGHQVHMGWSNLDNTSNYVRLMMCVDVVQKFKNIRLMGSQYKYKESPAEIPEFEIKAMTIVTARLLINVLHCPLSTIKFDNYPKTTIEDFYILDSLNRYCVYMMKPTQTSEILHIVAEICGIFVNIRYNKEELEEELKQKLNETSTDLNFLQWPELMDMSAENKLTICFEFYDKISYHTFHTNSNITYPIFKTSDQFKLVFNDGTKWNGHTQTLTCPMNEINFTTGYQSDASLQTTASKFHLTKSINPGCVYKVQMIRNMDNTNIHRNKDYRFLVSIQAELCGILDPIRTNKNEIQREFLSAWNDNIKESNATTMEQSNVTIPSFEFSTMIAIVQLRLCQNAYKKVFKERLILNSHGYQNRISKSPVFFNGISNIQVHAMRCYSGRKTTKNELYLLESVNLGCVYKLFKSRLVNFVEITAEICDVYPVNYLFNILRQAYNSRNFIIDPK